MQALLNYLKAILEWLISVVERGFEALWTMLKDMVIWALDGVMGAGVAILNTFGEQLTVQNFSSAWSQLPAEVIGMASALGIGEALGIIVAALIIRFLLQTIPFVRWGS